MPADHVMILVGKTTNLLSRNYDFYPTKQLILLISDASFNFWKKLIWKSKKIAEK